MVERRYWSACLDLFLYCKYLERKSRTYLFVSLFNSYRSFTTFVSCTMVFKQQLFMYLCILHLWFIQFTIQLLQTFVSRTIVCVARMEYVTCTTCHCITNRTMVERFFFVSFHVGSILK